MATALKAERDENTCRQPFKPTELAALGMALEKLERPKAEARQAEGQKRGRDNRGKVVPEKFSGTTRTPQKAYTREIVGDAIGMSGLTYQRAKAVVQAAEEDPEPQVNLTMANLPENFRKLRW